MPQSGQKSESNACHTEHYGAVRWQLEKACSPKGVLSHLAFPYTMKFYFHKRSSRKHCASHPGVSVTPECVAANKDISEFMLSSLQRWEVRPRP